jgi:hypothetical protein
LTTALASIMTLLLSHPFLITLYQAFIAAAFQA